MAEAVRREFWEWTKAIALAVILAWLLRSFLVQPYRVEGSSMEPSLHNQERLFLNRLVYRLRPPQRGDIVVVDLPEEGISIIKRVIGTPGDVLEVAEGAVWINGQRLAEPYLQQATLDTYGPVQVPEAHVFVMGDNRQNSRDSRSISVGFVPYKQIKGQAAIVYWPLQTARIISR